MSVNLAQRARNLGTVQKVLIAGAAVTTTALIGGGVAYASTSLSTPATTHHTSQLTTNAPAPAESTTGPDTDNVQSGDQSGPDTAGSVEKSGSAEKSGADTDNVNVQSGDQSGPDTAEAGTAG